MRPFTTHSGIAAPLPMANVDTDAIIPSREMKRPSRDGLGVGLFANWRYTTAGGREPQADFILNKSGWQNASILVCGENFGCGSSREHAVWALLDYGIRVVAAPSFGAIFYGNCIANGLLPARIDDKYGTELSKQLASEPRTMHFELSDCRLRLAGSAWQGFGIADADRKALLEGLDPIAMTLQHESKISAFIKRDQTFMRPWAHLKNKTSPQDG